MTLTLRVMIMRLRFAPSLDTVLQLIVLQEYVMHVYLIDTLRKIVYLILYVLKLSIVNWLTM